jgi:predicted HAD superfamily Cof-like phosphohydrolase
MSKSYKEPQGLSDVAEFHEVFDLPILTEPTIPAKERCQLRLNLLQEELDELKQAITDKDIVEIADALADIQYVLSGAVIEFGLAPRFKTLFDEVHRSNMSKPCQTMAEAEETQAHYLNNKGTESHIVERANKYFVYRNGDKKVLKSVNYSPADLGSIVKG